MGSMGLDLYRGGFAYWQNDMDDVAASSDFVWASACLYKVKRKVSFDEACRMKQVGIVSCLDSYGSKASVGAIE